MIDEDFVNGADRHLGGAGDGADGFAVGMAGEDDASLVGVDDAGPAAGAAAGAGGGEPVAGLADDVAAAILGESYGDPSPYSWGTQPPRRKIVRSA